MEKYKLPDLPYKYNDLEPYISSDILSLHHGKHHSAYVNGANAVIDKILKARENDLDMDYKSFSKSLSFNAGGHILHSLFWNNMAPYKSGKNKPSKKMLELIKKEFGSFERFKVEFSESAKSVEGSGWVALVESEDKDFSIIQIEKHNVNFYPGQKIILCIDVWEHAYYLDYKNDRAKFIENWWNIVNWEEVENRI